MAQFTDFLKEYNRIQGNPREQWTKASCASRVRFYRAKFLLNKGYTKHENPGINRVRKEFAAYVGEVAGLLEAQLKALAGDPAAAEIIKHLGDTVPIEFYIDAITAAIKDIEADTPATDIIAALTSPDMRAKQLKNDIDTEQSPDIKAQKIAALFTELETIQDQEQREYYERFGREAAIETAVAQETAPSVRNQLLEFTPFYPIEQVTVTHDPITRALVKGKPGEVRIGSDPTTGEAAIYTLLAGNVTLAEASALQALFDFKRAGQVTKSGFIYCTKGQLYRARRGIAGTGGAQKEQKEAEGDLIAAMAAKRIKFEVNAPAMAYGGFEVKNANIGIIAQPDIYGGTIRGQEDELLVFPNTPMLLALWEKVKMFECLPREVKAIKQYKYTLTLKEPVTIKGKKTKKRSFTSNEERRKFCTDNGIKAADIAEHGEQLDTWNQTEKRIAIREALSFFVFGYINARGAGRSISNKKPYSDIFEQCGINTNHREAVRRAKEDIATILDYWVKCEAVPWLKSWTEYTNKGSKRPDGVAISIGSAEGAE